MTFRSLILATSALTLMACTPPSQSQTAAPAAPEGPSLHEVEFQGPGAAYRTRAQNELRARIERPEYTGTAKNVILFIADGMSLGTVVATRIYDGQSKGMSGEDNTLPFEAWGHNATIKTYSDNGQVPDSAATATALMTGVKSHNGSISVYARNWLETCAADAALPRTILERAEDTGKSTGVISTARITHATPATTFAHVPHRDWENDAALPADAADAGCRDIARQLIEFNYGNGVDVVLGGGRASFLTTEEGGQRQDNRDLTQEWTQREQGGVYVDDRAGFDSLDPTDATPVLGLFTNSHMAYELDRDASAEPSLTEMTHFAIERLSQNEEGFFLMVEGGRVDHAHHATNAARALGDAQAFAKAIEDAANQVDLSETLILVTADHGHVFTIAGYPRRGNPILGLVHPPAPDLSDDPTPPLPAQDGRPYTTLGYYTGPNQRHPDGEVLTDEQVLDKDYRQQSAIPMGSETHSGEDVILYAVGPQAHLVNGVMEQNTVNALMQYAFGWEPQE
ncbi:alkaline phosphatase [Woodsholea maritima]|uniref:alkaline phosphatase n=1 Tax=Woodsholea maritima TaxID=240237 RepID=UPI000372C6E3|nr:alkaline phosphatase [Woodsholea maritima]